MKEFIISEVLRVNTLLGRRPTRTEFIEYSHKGVTRRVCEREVGTYNKVLFLAGLKDTHEQGSVYVPCKRCGKTIKKALSEVRKTKNSFCSQTCSAVFNNTLRGVRNTDLTRRHFVPSILCNVLYIKKLVLCQNCNKLYHKKSNRVTSSLTCSHFCSMELSMKSKTMQDLVVRKGANSYDSVRSNARNYSKYFYPKLCMLCGYDKHYEVCHVKDIKDFNSNSTIIEVNSRSNLVHLCPNCHWEFDNGRLDSCKILEAQSNFIQQVDSGSSPHVPTKHIPIPHVSLLSL